MDDGAAFGGKQPTENRSSLQTQSAVSVVLVGPKST